MKTSVKAPPDGPNWTQVPYFKTGGPLFVRGPRGTWEFYRKMGIDPAGVRIAIMPAGPEIGLDLAAIGRAGRVALDANATIWRLEGTAAQMQAVTKAVGGRSPLVSITAVKEFLVKGDVAALRAFLTETGGSVAKAGPKDLVKALQPLGLKHRDAEIVASAIVEKVKLITNDTDIPKAVASIVENF